MLLTNEGLPLEYRDVWNSRTIAKIIITILAWLNVDYGIGNLRQAELEKIFYVLSKEFPGIIPNFRFRKFNNRFISIHFSEALEQAQKLMPNLDYFYAREYLYELAEKEGKRFVYLFRPCAKIIFEILQEK